MVSLIWCAPAPERRYGSGTRKRNEEVSECPGILFLFLDRSHTSYLKTNKYAWPKVLKKAHARSDGAWEGLTPSEMPKFIGLVIFVEIVKVHRLKLYWNVRRHLQWSASTTGHAATSF